MQCHSCGHENPWGSRFCFECGSPQPPPPVICVACESELPSEAKFCNQCGTAVSPGAPQGLAGVATEATAPHERPEATPDSSEGEHRQLTVLFCDLVGSTELTTTVDPEELQSIIGQYQRAAGEAVARFGGHIAKYLGDGVVAYFGYPQAHDDDAERAVRAGLAIIDTMQVLDKRIEAAEEHRLAVRVAIDTGAVVVGRGGGTAPEVFGDTPIIAARLQAIAPPDGVVISSGTLRLIRGIFVIEDLGPQTLKGFPSPVAAYRVVQASGVRSRLDLPGERLTPFVGRAPEVGALLDRWERTREGHGQAVLISGEPGVGKTRLVHRFRQCLADEQHTWLECRCSPYSEHSAFQPVIELVEQGLASGSVDTPADKITALERGLQLAGFSLPEVVPLFADFLSIPVTDPYVPLSMSPDVQRAKTLQALVTWAQALGQAQPVVLLFEDLHWCDPSSLELLGHLIAQSWGTRVMTVLTARPEFASPWASHSYLMPIQLSRLTNPQVREMLAGMSADRRLPDPVVDQIADRADGIPLHVEELARGVIESGLLAECKGRYELTGPIMDLAIPSTLQDLLMARLDRLSAAKEVAQRAATIGREFSYALLEAVAGLDRPTLLQGLARLVASELLYQRGMPPEATYTFKHALIHDAAYQSLLKRTRQSLHAQIADALEARFPAITAAQPEVVARHYDAAGLANPAAAYYQRAGQQAASRSAHEEAIAHLQRGIKLLSGVPESRERNAREGTMQVVLGSSMINVRGYAHPGVRAAYERARVLCEDVGDTVQLGYALLGLSIFHSNHGDLGPGAELAERVLQIGEQTGEEAHLILGHTHVAIPQLYQGKFASALHHCKKAIEIYDPPRHRSVASLAGTDQGVAPQGLAAWSLWHLGYPNQALACVREGVELARRVEHPFSVAWALFFETGIHYWRRDVAAVRAASDEVVALGRDHGFPLWLGLGRAVRAWVDAWTDRDTNAVSQVSEGMDLAASTGAQLGFTCLIGMLAEAQQLVGRYEDALETLKTGIAMSVQTQQPYWDAELYRMKGEMILQHASGVQRLSELRLSDEDAPGPRTDGLSARVAEAEACLGRALEIARAQEAKSLELRTAITIAYLQRARGRPTDARETLAPVYGWFSEGFETYDLSQAKALLHELSRVAPGLASGERTGHNGGRPRRSISRKT